MTIIYRDTLATLQDAYDRRVIVLHPLVRFLGIASGFRPGGNNIAR